MTKNQTLMNRSRLKFGKNNKFRSDQRVPIEDHRLFFHFLLQSNENVYRHRKWLSVRHQLIKRLEWIVDGEGVGKARHYTRMGPRIHLHRQKQCMTPKANPLCEF